MLWWRLQWSVRKENCQQDDKLLYSCQPFLATCCLLKCLQVTPWACKSTKAVNCHSSTVCCPGNCLAQSFGLLSNNLPLLHLCLFFNRTSILYSFNCRCLICFPVDRSEVQERRGNNSFRMFCSSHVVPYHDTLMSWGALGAVGFGIQWVRVKWSGNWWWLIPQHLLGCNFSECLSLHLLGAWRTCGWQKWCAE